MREKQIDTDGRSKRIQVEKIHTVNENEKKG